jgi:hypothetical protein
MKQCVVWLTVAGLAIGVGAALAEEGGGHAAKVKPARVAKEGGGHAAKVAKAGKEGVAKVPTYKGIVGAKAADAPADVLAVLKTTVKKDGGGQEEKTYNLLATDASVADQIKLLANKGAEAAVTGTLTVDGTGINATAIQEKGARGGKGGERGGQARQPKTRKAGGEGQGQ